MTTAYTSLLGLALPVTGELSGTWGDTVNTAITSLLDTAVAGTTSITTDADITLSTTTGAANQARQAIILWNPASGTVTRNITAPAQSKMYTVINASGGTQSIVIRGAGPTTGVTVLKGESALVAWNGSDFVKVSSIGGAGTFTNLTVTGNTILGDAIGDTLTVNATTSFTAPVNLPSTGRSAAAALTPTNPAFLYGVASTYTDTTSSGTLAPVATFYSLARPTLSTSNVTTYTNAATLYIANSPAAGGSATITNPYALYIAAGNMYFGGSVASNLLFVDNLYDIGASGATRPRSLFLGTNLNVAGTAGIGTLATADVSLRVSRTATGDSQYGILNATTYGGTGTNVYGVVNQANIAAAASFSSYSGFLAVQPAYGAGATITSQTGFAVDTTLTGATNNFGFSSSIAAGTGRWNFYAAGTAANYFAGQAQFANGALATPSVSNINDINTGIYFPAADTIGFVEGGVEALRINTSGQTSTSIAGTAALPSFTRTGDENTGIFFPAADTIAFSEGGAEAMRIDNAGNVGIGTSSPSGNLNVNTTGNTSVVISAGNTGLSRLIFQGQVGNNRGFIDYDNTSSVRAMIFRTDEAERARIDSSGNLLVGTTSGLASSKLVVASASGVARISVKAEVASASDASLYLECSGVNSGEIAYLRASQALAFYNNGIERARITSTGNFLIATTGNGSPGLGVSNSQNISFPESTDNTSLATMFRQASSGDFVLGSGVRYSNNANAFASSFGSPWARTAINVGYGAIKFFTAAEATVAVGTDTTLNERMRIDSNGRVQIATTANKYSATLTIVKAGNSYNITSSVSGTGSSGHMVFENNDADAVGTIFTSGSTTSYNTSSDYRLKNITGPITNSGAYIDSLEPCEGTWKADGSTFVGLIAHKTQEVSRTPVATGVKDGEEMQGMDYSSAEIIANLIAEVQSLRKRLAAANI